MSDHLLCHYLMNLLWYWLITARKVLRPVLPVPFRVNRVAVVGVNHFSLGAVLRNISLHNAGQQDQPGGLSWERKSRLHRSQRNQTEGERKVVFHSSFIKSKCSHEQTNKCTKRLIVHFFVFAGRSEHQQVFNHTGESYFCSGWTGVFLTLS